MPATPLSTLLSQVLVAYTIEFDYEIEARVPHITTIDRAARSAFSEERPWLVSQVMWANFIRHVADEGTPVREVQARACLPDRAIKNRLHHLEWWKYVTFAPDPSDKRAKPRYRDLLVHLGAGARRLRDEGHQISGDMEKRWRTRFGKSTIEDLSDGLRAIVGAGVDQLPDYMPVVEYSDGMRATVTPPQEPPAAGVQVERLPLWALLSKVLLPLTLEFERDSETSLTVAANVLRPIEGGGTAMRELPMRGGVAKEGVTAAINFLAKKGLVTQGSDKQKLVELTPAGAEARKKHAASLAAIERRWTKSHGAGVIDAVRASLEEMGSGVKRDKPLYAVGMEIREGSWRAVKPYGELTAAFVADPPTSLPHHPMVLHRGGFPDGS